VPFVVGGAVGEAMSAVGLGTIMIIFTSIILSALSLVVRYQWARGVERQQLKWFALAAALNGGLILADQFRLDRSLGAALWNLLDVTTFAALYVAVGIAILRHRLFDIDVVINRTLVYGSLTACWRQSTSAVWLRLRRSFVSSLPNRTCPNLPSWSLPL